MFDIIVRSLNICLCGAGIYYVIYHYRTSDNHRLSRIFSLVMVSFIVSNAFALLHSATKSPIIHLLFSYSGAVIPMLLVTNIFLVIHYSEKNKLKQKERKLIALQNIGEKANSTLDLKQTAQLTLGEILQTLPSDGIALYLLSKDKGYLELLWAEGVCQEVADDIAIIPAKEILFAFSTIGADLIDIVNNAHHIELQGCNAMEAIGIKDAFAVQLSRQQEPIGIMVLASKKTIELGEERRNFVINAATWISIAISNSQLYEDMRSSYLKIAVSFSKAVEAKDPYTGGHSDNVAKLSAELAAHLGLSKSEIEKVYLGGRLHDVGKIGIPGVIINKTGALTVEEYQIIRDHTFKGFEITQPIDGLIKISDIVVYHHERYDGQGYPLGLSGEKIPFLARITAIADAFDSMTSDRSYRKGMPYKKALEIIEANKGTQFDPVLATHFIEMMKDKMERKNESNISADELAALINETLSFDEKAAG